MDDTRQPCRQCGEPTDDPTERCAACGYTDRAWLWMVVGVVVVALVIVVATLP